MSLSDPTSLDALPPELRLQVRAELQPGEQLVWVGQPLWRPVRDLGCLLLFVAMMLLGGGLLAHLIGDESPFVQFWEYGWWITGGLTLACLVLAPWLVHKKTWYAVTNQRVILSELVPFRMDPAGPPGIMERMTRSYRDLEGLYRIEGKDGSGDLVFEQYRYEDEDGKTLIGRRGFKNIAAVRQVEELVRETLLREG